MLRHQKVLLIEEDLRKLDSIACHPVLSPMVHDVTLVTPVYVTKHLRAFVSDRDRILLFPKQSRQATEDLRWMQIQNGSQGCAAHRRLLTSALVAFENLTSITLVGEIFGNRGTYRDQDLGLEAARMEVRTTVEACRDLLVIITNNRLPITALRMFRSSRSKLTTPPELGSMLIHFNKHDMQTLGEGLKSFALSFATYDPIQPDGRPIYNSIDQEPHLQEISFNVPRLLSSMSHLTELDLSLYTTSYRQFFDSSWKVSNAVHERAIVGISSYQPKFDKIFHQIVITVFPALKTCTFGGFYATPEDLLHFLSHHSHLETFKLEHIRLTTGSWRLIIPRLSTMQTLRCVTLNSLLENLSLHICDFALPEDNDKSPIWNSLDWWFQNHVRLLFGRTFDQAQLKQGIQWRSLRSTGPGCDARRASWARRMARAYG